MIDFFSLFKGLIVILAVFGVVIFFELMGLLQAIKYYKTGELIVGTRSQDIFWRENKTADFISAIIFLILGIGIFISFNIPAFFISLLLGVVTTSFHILVLFIILRWYWKKKTIEANQKEDVQGT